MLNLGELLYVTLFNHLSTYTHQLRTLTIVDHCLIFAKFALRNITATDSLSFASTYLCTELDSFNEALMLEAAGSRLQNLA